MTAPVDGISPSAVEKFLIGENGGDLAGDAASAEAQSLEPTQLADRVRGKLARDAVGAEV